MKQQIGVEIDENKEETFAYYRCSKVRVSCG